MRSKFFGFSKPSAHKENTTWLKHDHLAGGSIDFEALTLLSAQMKMIDLTVDDLNILRCVHPLIKEHMNEIVESFYKSVIDVEELEQIISKYSTIDRLRTTLQVHLNELFNGHIDKHFIEKRLRIGEIHHRIGLEPKWYMGAFQNLQNAFMNIVFRTVHNSEESLIISKAITKLLNFEQQLVLEAYEKKNMEQKTMQYESIKQELKGKIIFVTEELAALTEETTASVEELMATSNNVNHSANHTASKASDSKSLAVTGTVKIDQLSERISSIYGSAQSMGAEVEQLVDSSQKIKNIVTIVAQISSQIKILSLNAAIEAARAGEHGRGFSVVAGEIRRLSDDTNKAVGQIGELIRQSSIYTEHVADSIKEVHKHVSLGQQEAFDANEVFNNIRLSLESSMTDIEKINDEIGSLVMAIEEIGSRAIKVASTTEDLNETTRNL